MERSETGKRETSFVGVQCKRCGRNYDPVVDKNYMRSTGWRLVTRESDDRIENFCLCPHCLSRRPAEEL